MTGSSVVNHGKRAGWFKNRPFMLVKNLQRSRKQALHVIEPKPATDHHICGQFDMLVFRYIRPVNRHGKVFSVWLKSAALFWPDFLYTLQTGFQIRHRLLQNPSCHLVPHRQAFGEKSWCPHNLRSEETKEYSPLILCRFVIPQDSEQGSTAGVSNPRFSHCSMSSGSSPCTILVYRSRSYPVPATCTGPQRVRRCGKRECDTHMPDPTVRRNSSGIAVGQNGCRELLECYDQSISVLVSE